VTATRTVRISKWLTSLASLISPSFPGPCDKAMRPFIPFLDNVPIEAFTQRSLEAVTLAPRRQQFPSLDEVKLPLLAWWRDQPAAIQSGISEDGLARADQRWLDWYHRAVQEGPGSKRFAMTPEMSGLPLEEAYGIHILGLVRSQSIAAWRKITGEDPDQLDYRPMTAEQNVEFRARLAAMLASGARSCRATGIIDSEDC
jgi:hypothetical protein